MERAARRRRPADPGANRAVRLWRRLAEPGGDYQYDRRGDLPRVCEGGERMSLGGIPTLTTAVVAPLLGPWRSVAAENGILLDMAYPAGDVRRYRAKNNAIDDDTSAVNNLMTVVAALGGGKARLVGGSGYNVTGLVIPSNVHLSGDGVRSTFLRITANTSCVRFAQGTQYASVENLAIVVANAGASVAGIEFKSGSAAAPTSFNYAQN